MEFLALFLILTVSCPGVFSETRVTVYDHHKFKGKSYQTSDLDVHNYATLGKLNDKTTSYKINRGTCIEMHMDSPPRYSGRNNFFRTTTREMSNIGRTYNDRISSIKACPRYWETKECPKGTFVKKIEWDKNSLRNGVKLYCSKPESKQTYRELRFQGSGTLAGKFECDAIRGITFTRHFDYDVDLRMEPFCQQRENNGYTKACEKGQALTGLQLQRESYSGYVKSSSVICKDVGKVEEKCNPKDKWNTLLTCDASLALHPISCTRAKKVGYGVSKAMSKEQRTEQRFYQEMGFEVGTAGFGLSATFKGTLGTSTTTGYSWSTTDESTFHQEETITIHGDTPAGCVTQFEEVIGECSFLTVSPNNYRRRDVCKNSTFITNFKMPGRIEGKAVFVSKIPKAVLAGNQMSKG